MDTFRCARWGPGQWHPEHQQIAAAQQQQLSTGEQRERNQGLATGSNQRDQDRYRDQFGMFDQSMGCLLV
ncbi:MAG: hypothetical protein IPO43_02305 [Rhodoferax sp.]|nr:hypothetical protein [Rhodoferax sp.]